MLKVINISGFRRHCKIVLGHVLPFFDTSQNQFSLRNYSSLNLQVCDSALQKYVYHLESEYKTLQKQVKNLNEHDNTKRLQELQPIIDIITERKKIFDYMSSLKELCKEDQKDEDLLALVDLEQQGYKNKLEKLDIELIEALLPEDSYDQCTDIVLEVTAGVGGQEAMLFARELFDMYCGYAEFKCWKADIAQLEHTEIGGLRHASLFISGEKVFQHLKHEAGVHRVQRVPTTEKSGRVHTSTVTVAAFPQPEEVDVQLKDKDLRVETKRASGAGGQHVNTTDSAVRITHIPTGLAVESQVDRSQNKNREIALQRLRAKIFQQQIDQQQMEINLTRKQQVGSSFRSEKIRTYNFNQDRITDHRISGNVHNLRDFLCGNQLLDNLIHNLHQVAKEKRLKETISQYATEVSKT